MHQEFGSIQLVVEMWPSWSLLFCVCLACIVVVDVVLGGVVVVVVAVVDVRLFLWLIGLLLGCGCCLWSFPYVVVVVTFPQSCWNFCPHEASSFLQLMAAVEFSPRKLQYIEFLIVIGKASACRYVHSSKRSNFAFFWIYSPASWTNSDFHLILHVVVAWLGIQLSSFKLPISGSSDGIFDNQQSTECAELLIVGRWNGKAMFPPETVTGSDPPAVVPTSWDVV